MAIEDVFNGVKSGMALFGAYFKTVADELGMEKALSLLAKMFETRGAMRGNRFKEQVGVTEFDAKAALPLVKDSLGSFGYGVEVLKESPTAVRWKVGRCPDFEGLKMAGLDEKTIEAYCRCGSKGWEATVKQLNPNLSFRLRVFRSAPDDFCEEEIVLK